MALIFQRLARNFIKNGYFPTDEESIRRILNLIQPASAGGLIRMVDTCCGEGIALAECAHHFKELGSSVFSAGVEFDKERAYHAKGLLDVVVHSDFESVVMSRNQFQLMWLNPPYGDRMRPGLEQSASTGRDRLEKLFLSRSIGGLNFGGLLIYIVPNYVLDKSLCDTLARTLNDIAIYRLPEQRFKQVVILGYRKKSDLDGTLEMRQYLRSVGEDILNAPELPEASMPLYAVPPSTADKKDFELRTAAFDPDQFALIRQQHPCLWSDAPRLLRATQTVKRPPARRPSSWHMSLMLAAGQVSGVVNALDGPSLLIKGGTHKSKVTRTSVSTDDEGNVEEVIVKTDVFVPIIKGIDISPDSETFGNIFTIR